MRRDVDVFLRTYLPAGRNSRRPLEESFDCPLVELGLLEKVDSMRYTMRRGPRPSLPIEILVLAVLEFWQDSAPDQNTLALERLLFDAGSPGAAFRLGSRDLVSMLEQTSDDCGLRYDETAGMRVVRRTPGHDETRLLSRYYGAAA